MYICMFEIIQMSLLFERSLNCLILRAGVFVRVTVGRPAPSRPAIRFYTLKAYGNVTCALLCALNIGMLMQHATVT